MANPTIEQQLHYIKVEKLSELIWKMLPNYDSPDHIDESAFYNLGRGKCFCKEYIIKNLKHLTEKYNG